MVALAAGVNGVGVDGASNYGKGSAALQLRASTSRTAAQRAAEGVDVLADLQGSVEYKAHLCRVFAKRAVEAASKRA